MRAREVVLQQNDFVTRWNAPDRVLRDASENMIASMWRIKDGEAEAERLAPRVGRSILDAFVNGETYMVNRDMTDLVDFAASRLDESDRVDLDMVPSKWGVVRFERPLVMTDLRGVEMWAHWMTWSPSVQDVTDAFGRTVTRKGVVLSWWNDLAEPDAVAREMLADRRPGAREVLRRTGRWSLVGVDHMGDGMRLGPMTHVVTEDDLAVAARLDADLLGMDRPTRPVTLTEVETKTLRWAWALFLLLDQEIVTTRQPHYSRADVKTLGRVPRWNEVRVVELRRMRHERPQGEPGSVNWTHRWIVKGHWRWQPYGDGTVRRIWIDPYVKGPEDLPFVATKKVYRLAR